MDELNHFANTSTWKSLHTGIDPLIVPCIPILSSVHNIENISQDQFFEMFKQIKSNIKSLSLPPHVSSHSIKLIQNWMIINISKDMSQEKQFYQLLQNSATKTDYSKTAALASLLCNLNQPTEDFIDLHEAVDNLLKQINAPSLLPSIKNEYQFNSPSLKTQLIIVLSTFLLSCISLHYLSVRFFL